jgi:hypothetical protein
MSFVFISHANRDKPKIKHIVDKLIASGIKVWLDNPTASPLRYGAKEIEAHFHRIRAGEVWYKQIKDALRQADVVLVCFSENFGRSESRIFHNEVTIADYEGKLVACRIDDIDPSTLPVSFAAQVADLRIDLPNPGGETHRSGRHPRAPGELENLLENLVADIRSKMLNVRFDRAGRAIQYYSCFISYSTKDQDFAERIHADLQNKGVRCWFAPHDMRIGDKILNEIDTAIRLQDKLLLILSEHSINSKWVEDEVTKAFEEERKRKQIVLFPIRLDNAVMDTDEAWAAKLRARLIGDFTSWKEHNAYHKSFERVLRGLAPKPTDTDPRST